jgi:hypothetical protein
MVNRTRIGERDSSGTPNDVDPVTESLIQAQCLLCA